MFYFNELMGSLQAHEARLNRTMEQIEEKVLWMKGKIPNSQQSGNRYEESEQVSVRGRGSGSFRGQGMRGRGRGCSIEEWRRQPIQCYYCKRYGHVKANCWKKANQVNYAEEADEGYGEEIKLFMEKDGTTQEMESLWFLDNGCSNHMTDIYSLFKDIDDTYRMKVRLGDDKQMQVEGKGIVAIDNAKENIKLISNVLFVPSISHNLLSVVQLMQSGMSVLFENNSCLIGDTKTSHVIAEINMTKNKLFSMEISNLESYAMVVKEKETSKLWHMRHGHLNEKIKSRTSTTKRNGAGLATN